MITYSKTHRKNFFLHFNKKLVTMTLCRLILSKLLSLFHIDVLTLTYLQICSKRNYIDLHAIFGHELILISARFLP